MLFVPVPPANGKELYVSYDLLLTADAARRVDPEALRSRLQGTAGLESCEIHFYDEVAEPSSEERDLLVVNLPADEGVVERVFADLRLVAKEHGLRLHDPQSGEDVDLDAEARLPEMFGP